MIDVREMTVLIVDDMITMCRSIHKMMKVVGYGRTVFYAHNGKEAISILDRETIDLVLVDYLMPVMNGADLVRYIRNHRELRYLPVLMITAQAFMEFVAEAAESDIDAYILKPLTIKVLEEKIDYVVDRVNNPPPMVRHLMEARHQEASGDLNSAIEEAKAAMAEAPDSSRPIREVGYYYYQMGNLDQAENWMLQAAEMNRLDVFAFHYLGEIYIQRNDIENAQHYLEKAMKISPRHLRRGIKFGKTLAQMDLDEQAVKIFDGVLKMAENSPEIREEIADCCLEDGLFEYAAKLWESILKEQPTRKDLFFKLGQSLKGAGHVYEGLNYLHRAEKHDAENIEIKIQIAQTYLMMEKCIMAERVIKSIQNLDPENPTADELMNRCIEMETFQW